MERVDLSPEASVPCDRLYALALANTEFDPENPQFLRKIHFLMLMRDEQLALLDTEFIEDGHRLIIRKAGVQLLNASLLSREGREEVAVFFENFMGAKLKGRPRVVTAEGHMFADVSKQNLSMINLDSVRDLESKTGLSIDPNRFRGNLIVEGLGAWKEFDLVGQSIEIGEVTFAVTKRIDRCAATNVNLETAERDMNIPLQIRKNYGHIDCGVYVDVIKGGTLTVGDTIQAL
ncbi:MAG: MOSC domain-containing protein [Kordiimonas sp.]